MEIIENVVKKLQKIKNIKIVILFGSTAKGKAREDSDIDICVIANNQKSEMKALEYNSEKIDISAFSRLPLVIQYRVFKDGKVLFNKDDKLLTKIKFWTVTRYLDEKHWRDRFTEKVLG